MRKLPKWFLPAFFVLIIGIVAGSAYFFSEKTFVFATGTIRLDEGLTDQAQGIKNLYLVLYDADSQIPMPYGAQRDMVSGRFEKGETILTFFLTQERVQLMNPAAPAPRRLRIKARLDRDGLAGPDQAGDLFGELSSVPLGSQGVELLIDQVATGDSNSPH
jgi:hypothetical protein